MSSLTLTIADGVAEIGLDDGKANALSQSMLDALLAAMAQAAEADCALLIYGRPGCFSGGYDRKLIDSGGPACNAMRAAGDRLTLALLDYPGPVVMASTGHAMAKAAFMLLLADYRLGAAGAFRIGLNEVAIGMTMPDAAMLQARARLAPHGSIAAPCRPSRLTRRRRWRRGFLMNCCRLSNCSTRPGPRPGNWRRWTARPTAKPERCCMPRCARIWPGCLASRPQAYSLKYTT